MLRNLLLFSLVISIHGHCKSPSPYIESLQKRYQTALTELGDAGVGDALNLEQRELPNNRKLITDEENIRVRFPAIYWANEDVSKSDDDPNKYVKLNENEVTQIPKGFNNILSNVIENGFAQNVEISDQEANEKSKSISEKSMKYVHTSESYQRSLKDVTDPKLYFKADKIYKQAQDDIKKLKEKSVDIDTTQRLLGEYLLVSTDLENHSKMEQLSRGLSGTRKSVGEEADSHGIKQSH